MKRLNTTHMFMSIATGAAIGGVASYLLNKGIGSGLLVGGIAGGVIGYYWK